MGYAVDQVIVDGVSVTPTLSYIFTNVRAIPTELWGAPKETVVRVSVLDLQSREVMVSGSGEVFGRLVPGELEWADGAQ